MFSVVLGRSKNIKIRCSLPSVEKADPCNSVDRKNPNLTGESVKASGKKKGQPVRIGLDSLGTRMVARFPKMVPGAGLEPARLAAGDFESPDLFI